MKGPTRAHLSSDAKDFRYIRREAKDIERAIGRLERRDRNMSHGRATTMPLVHGYSPKSIEANIVREMRAGRPQPQAVAIAFEEARKAWRHAHPRGPYPAHLRGMRKARRHGGGRNRTAIAEGAGYYSLSIPYQAQFSHGGWAWMPTESTGPFATRSVGAFTTKTEASQWAKRHLPKGAKYRIRHFT